MSTAFQCGLGAILALSLFGLPIGHAMIAGSILYLMVAGQDLAIAAEQLLNGMYTNYIILAVPLFVLAAELMNIGSMTDRLLGFCNALVGRFRGGLAQVNVLQSVIFAVAAIVRYLWLGFRALKGGAPDAFDPTKANSGV